MTPGFFNVFGIAPAIGRVIATIDETPGSPFAAVISHDFWMRRFGGRPDVLGSTVSFADRTFTIVGVMPRAFGFPAPTDIWYPAWVQPETTSRSAHNYRVVARLKEGAGVEQAQAELTALAARLERTYPASNDGKGAIVVPLQEQLVGETRPTLNSDRPQHRVGARHAEVHDHRRRGRRRALERSVAAARPRDLHAIRAAPAHRHLAGDRGADHGRAAERGEHLPREPSAP